MELYRIFLDRKALKQRDKIRGEAHDRIVEAMRTMRDEGLSRRLDIVKLKGHKNHYRLRVGRYRILFELGPERTITVYAVLSRERAY